MFTENCQMKLVRKIKILGGEGESHIKRGGVLVGNFKLTPKGDQSDCGPGFF